MSRLVVPLSERCTVSVEDGELRLTVPRCDVRMRGRDTLGVLAAEIRLRDSEVDALYARLRLERTRRTGAAQ